MHSMLELAAVDLYYLAWCFWSQICYKSHQDKGPDENKNFFKKSNYLKVLICAIKLSFPQKSTKGELRFPSI